MLSQAQTPLTHDLPPLQGMPQPPQLAGSKLGSTQAPPQQMAPGEQVPHEPPSGTLASGVLASRAPPSAPGPQPVGLQVPGWQSAEVPGRQTPAPSHIRGAVKTEPAQEAGAHWESEA
jgi:hypothetical protein